MRASRLNDTIAMTIATTFVIAGAATAEPGCGIFANPTYATAMATEDVELGDVNGDGRLDIVAMNRQDENLSVLLADGDGTFLPQTQYPTGGFPKHIAVGDFDGDGDADVAVTDVEADSVLVYLSNKGVLGPATFVGVGSFPDEIVAGDVDGDGDLDLALVDGFADEAGILLGNGDGTFTAQVTYGVGDNPRSLTLADLDGDEDLDIATTNWVGDDVSVLLNAGDGTYGLPTNFAAGDAPSSVKAGDLDGDGDNDLAVTNYTSEDVSILLNDGGGTFTLALSIPMITGRPLDVAMADLDDDGDNDIVAMDSTLFAYGSITLIHNNGNLVFETTRQEGGLDPEAIAIDDANGDGKLDLVIANGFVANVSIVAGNGDGTFATSAKEATGQDPRDVAIGDFNGDGIPDLATANMSGDPNINSDVGGDTNISVMFGNGDGTFTNDVWYPLPGDEVKNAEGIAAGDLDGDGDVDIAVSNKLGYTVSLFFNNGDGTFADAVSFGYFVQWPIWDTDPSSPTYGEVLEGFEVVLPQVVTLGDLDDDGDLDMVTSGWNMFVYLNNGNGTFVEVPYTNVFSPHDVRLGDLDEDGDLDLAVAEVTGWVLVLRNDSFGFFEIEGIYDGGPGLGMVDIGDVDGDGDLDIAASNWFIFQAPEWPYGYSVTLLMQEGTPGSGTWFTMGDSYPMAERPRTVRLGDLDDDGDLDMAVGGNTSDGFSIRLNEGGGIYGNEVRYATGDGPWNLRLADMDLDGDLDVVVPNHLEDTVSVALNVCPETGCAADLDGDGAVGFTDLTQLLGTWGVCAACPEDLDGDATVGFTDLTTLLGNWGPCDA